MKIRFFWPCLLFALVAAVARAQPGTDAAQCKAITNNPDLAIKYCTAAIDSGKLSGRDLALAHFYRGVEWMNKRDHDRAIADYTAAIGIDPKFADPYHNRGTAWADKGEPDRAIADFDAALHLNPQDAGVFHSRAVEWTVKGDYARAIADYDTALRLDPKATTVHFARARTLFYAADYGRAIDDFEKAHKFEPSDYTALWLFLARKRGEAAAAEELLERDTRTTRDGGWPAVIIALYVGQTNPETVMNMTTDRDPDRQRSRLCEANFYLAHWHLLRGAREPALPLLREAQRICPKNFLEYEGAVAEARKLQQR